MGKYNSSLTRVKPLIDQMKNHQDFPTSIVSVIAPHIKIQEPINEIAYGNNEKALMSSKELLKYLVTNYEILNLESLGADYSSETYKKRKKLFAGDSIVQTEALSLIDKDKSCKNKWYVFEGYTYPDIYIETENYIIVVEAKRTEKDFTTRTKWLDDRDQLIRHIDSVLDSKKKLISMLILDQQLTSTKEYKTGLANYTDNNYFIKNLPHRSKDLVAKAIDSYIGYATWQMFEDKYGVEYINKI